MKNHLAIALLGLSLPLVSCGKKESANTAGTDTPAADGTYILASGDLLPARGKTRVSSQVMEMNAAEITFSMGEKQMAGVMNQKTESVEKTEPLSDGKLRHVTVSETDTGTISMEGQEQETPPKNNPLVGMPVILEVKDGKLTASLEKGEPDAAQQAELDDLIDQYEAREDFVMYGDVPRKPGDKWNVDPSKLTNFGGGTGLTGTFTVEFTGVEEIGGVNCARLACEFDLTGKTIREGEEPEMNIAIKGKADVTRSIQDRADLDVKIDGTIVVEGSPAEGMAMKVEGPVKMTQTIELE